MSAESGVTGVVLTYNESQHIAECLESLAWADAVLVFDSFSTDDTVELARRHGAVVLQHPFENFAQQRNAALAHVQTPWVFFLDADERVPAELVEEIRGVLTREEAGWWVPRRNFIVGKWIQHAGWYPDYQLRLFRADRGRYDPQRVMHEVVLLEGKAGYLQNPLIHYNYDSWGEFIEKQLRYARLDARMQVERGVRPRPWTYFLQPLREFRRRYITWQGYRDGWHGLVLSLLMAYTAFRTTLEVRRILRAG